MTDDRKFKYLVLRSLLAILYGFWGNKYYAALREELEDAIDDLGPRDLELKP